MPWCDDIAGKLVPSAIVSDEFSLCAQGWVGGSARIHLAHGAPRTPSRAACLLAGMWGCTSVSALVRDPLVPTLRRL